MAQSEAEIRPKPASHAEEALTEEVAHLRRTLRDLVALSALPTLWTAPDLPHVAESLADALLSTLRLDFVVVCLKAAPGGGAVEAIRVARSSDIANPVQVIRPALSPWLDGESLSLPTAISNPLGSGTVQVAGVPIGHAAELGMLVAGSHRSDFPTETDRLLLRVGANQAAVVLARSKAEKALHESEERLRLITASARCILWDADVVERGDGALAWNLRVWDEEAAKRFLPVPIIAGAGFVPSWYESRLPEDKARMGVYGPAELRAGGNYRQEFRCRMADGSIRWLAEDVAAVPMAPGRWKAVGVCVDITERKRAEDMVRESEERLRGIFNQTITGIAQTDLAGRFVQVNERYCEIVGRSAEDLHGLRMQDITRPDDLPRNLDLFLPLVQGVGPPFVIEKRYVRPDGADVWVSNSVSLICDGHGEPKYVVAVSLDITERRQAEEALRESEERYRSLTQAITSVVWTTDAQGRFVTPQLS